MSNEQERAAFEAWAREHSPSLRLAHSVNVADLYHSPITNLAWGAWQARAALAAQQVPAITESMRAAGGAVIERILAGDADPDSTWNDAANVFAAMLAAAPQAPLDVCTDPYNCKRCDAPQWDKHKFEHAGIAAGVKEPGHE